MNWYLKVFVKGSSTLNLPFVSKQNLKVRSPKDSKDQTAKNSLEGQSHHAIFY